MRKQELVAAVKLSTGLTAAQADEVVSSVVEQITNALARDETVTLVGFGSFRTKLRAARSGKNPSTGASIAIPASHAVSFKAGEKLRNLVAAKSE
ncbi:HU family DNA-binding protein [Teredinibacter waterburyi]|uniref:HU family DNA-binding protein n=1 Tax=Teredinibacter waterburyi TaxID=1500538 RepID=UPI00165F8782|nr:HU family DNA-binding protein [Teredinibacter waterburyi]